MLFIHASSSHFAGYHWAIYDEAKSFYSYDDGDAIAGDPCGNMHSVANAELARGLAEACICSMR